MIGTAELERAVGGLVVARAPYSYASSASLEHIELDVPGRPRQAALLKETSLASLQEPARSTRPTALHDAGRERSVYRSVLEGAGLGTPDCLGAAAGEHPWLLLEHVDGVELWQVPFDGWLQVAGWLGVVHSALGRRRPPPGLVRQAPALWRWFLTRAVAFLGASRLQPVVDVHEVVCRELSRAPWGMIHGELYPSNVLLAGDRVVLLDWEMAALGPRALDLAALTGGCDEATRERILDAYVRTNPVPVSRETLLRHVDLARVVLAVQWLGWSDGWRAPPVHALDWLAEATEAVGALEL